MCKLTNTKEAKSIFLSFSFFSKKTFPSMVMSYFKDSYSSDVLNVNPETDTHKHKEEFLLPFLIQNLRFLIKVPICLLTQHEMMHWIAFFL